SVGCGGEGCDGHGGRGATDRRDGGVAQSAARRGGARPAGSARALAARSRSAGGGRGGTGPGGRGRRTPGGPHRPSPGRVGERLGSLEADDRSAQSELVRVASESESARGAIREAHSGLAACEESLAAAGAEEAEHREALTAARIRIEALEDLKSAMEGLEE